VKVVTVYAFSIENFKRSKYEVDMIMDLGKSHLTQLATHGYVSTKHTNKVIYWIIIKLPFTFSDKPLF
jgi:ditrans,polycis-polyprenyl diphosphate synthase